MLHYVYPLLFTYLLLKVNKACAKKGAHEKLSRGSVSYAVKVEWKYIFLYKPLNFFHIFAYQIKELWLNFFQCFEAL